MTRHNPGKARRAQIRAELHPLSLKPPAEPMPRPADHRDGSFGLAILNGLAARIERQSRGAR